MTLRLYNTMTRSVDPLEPLEEGRLRVYACGPTIYDYAHIGNFRSFTVYDLLHRYLEWKGYDVRFVMNLTDVDDKTIDAAVEEGLTVREYTRPYGDAFLGEAEALGIRPADSYPVATEFVPRMVELVERLLEKGLAYVTDDGAVYFGISSFPGYGKLSGKDPDQMKSGARVAQDEYEKEDARDFALWKPAKPQDEEAGAAWDSPWGRGRPGWHLECSVMSLSELGDTLDIHLGGEDLVFPHHENEIAQSEGATGETFVRHWFHVKHLVLEDEKMSKSVGNTVTVRELLDEGFAAAAVRHQLLSAHYRSTLNFTMDGLEASTRAVQRLAAFEARLQEAEVDDNAPESSLSDVAREGLEAFEEAMDEDLNSAQAMAALFTMVNRMNGVLDDSPSGLHRADRDAALEALESIDGVLGLLELNRRDRDIAPEKRAWIEERIEARQQARQEKDFQEADRIRDELLEEGLELEDTPRGTRWRKARKVSSAS